MTVILGPDFELQKAIATVLEASTDLKTLLGNPIRLYQKVPPNPVFPYVTIGESQNTPDLAECIDGSEVFPVIHIWTRAQTYADAKKISANIWAVLSAASFTLTENRLLVFERDSIGDQTGVATDTVTQHIASHYRALLEPV